MWDQAVPFQVLLLLPLPLSPKSPLPTQSTWSHPLPSGPRKDLTCSHWGLEGHGDCPLWRVPPGTYIFPAQCGFAALAENISYRVQPREQEALFSWPATHVDPVSGNRKDPAPSGVALSVQPPSSPKATSIWREPTQREAPAFSNPALQDSHLGLLSPVR